MLNVVGAAATRLKARLDLNYKSSNDACGRTFAGMHDTVLPLCHSALSIFQQIRGTKAKTSRRKTADAASADAPKLNGQPSGHITGVHMRHLLLLLPFLLFDLLADEVSTYNERHGTAHESPANTLITLVLALLEWYRLYRYICANAVPGAVSDDDTSRLNVH